MENKKQEIDTHHNNNWFEAATVKLL